MLNIPALSCLQAIECTLQFFCLNTSAACGCSDASQPMFSFDVPFRFSDVDDLQTGLLSGDVVQTIFCGTHSLFVTFFPQTILPGSKDNKTEAAAAFDAKNQTEGGMCALINSGCVFSACVLACFAETLLAGSF